MTPGSKSDCPDQALTAPPASHVVAQHAHPERRAGTEPLHHSRYWPPMTFLTRGDELAPGTGARKPHHKDGRCCLRRLLQSRLKKLRRLLLDTVQLPPPHPATPRSSQEDNYLWGGRVEKAGLCEHSADSLCDTEQITSSLQALVSSSVNKITTLPISSILLSVQ